MPHCCLGALTRFFPLWYTWSTILYSPLPSRLNSILWKKKKKKEILQKKQILHPNQFKNNRHVLNLPFPSKLLKQVILQLTQHMNNNNLTHVSVRLSFRPQHGDSASPCFSWPSPIRWHWQCFCSDIIRPLSCIWRNRPPHYLGSCPELLWNFWSYYRLVSVMPFRPWAKLIISVDDLWSDQAVLQFGIPQFSPGAHFVRFVYSPTIQIFKRT